MDREYDLEELLREFSSLNEESERPAAPAPKAPDPVPQAASVPEAEEAPAAPQEDEPVWQPPQADEAYPPAPPPEEDEEDWEDEDAAPAPNKNIFFEVLMAFAGLIFLGVTGIALLWVVLNVHPDAGTATTVAGDTRLSLTENLDIYMNNAASDALGDLAYIRKIYTIEESATVAPVPNPNGFGTTDDPAVIQALIDQAWELLEGQEMIWRPDADFVPGEPMRY